MVRPLLKVQMWFFAAGAKDSAPCQKWAKTTKHATLRYTTLQLQLQLELQPQLTALHNTTLITLDYATLRYTTLHCTTLRYSTRHSITFCYSHYNHNTSYNYITAPYTTCTTAHYTKHTYNYNDSYSTLRYSTLMTEHYTTLHSTTPN